MYDTLGLVAKGDFTPISISNCAATFNKKGHFTPIWISNCVPPIKHADKGNPGGTWAIRGTGLPLQGASLTFNTKSYNLYLTAKRLNLIFIGTKTKGGGQCDCGGQLERRPLQILRTDPEDRVGRREDRGQDIDDRGQRTG